MPTEIRPRRRTSGIHLSQDDWREIRLLVLMSGAACLVAVAFADRLAAVASALLFLG